MEAATLALDLDALLRGIPPGSWVAISSDHSHVVSFGAEIQQVISQATEKGEPNPLVVRVPEQAVSLFV